LITEEDWREAEATSPVNLRGVAARLGLPPEGAVAWQRAKLWNTGSSSVVVVPVSKQIVESLTGSTDGVGGHQALFRRVLTDCRKVRFRLRVTYSDFLLARERACTCRGGWRDYYSILLSALEQPIFAAGGSDAFFAEASRGVAFR
jgi:hypothetical protein